MSFQFANQLRQRWGSVLARRFSSERGALLAEMVIVMAVFVLLGTGMLSALQTSIYARSTTELSAVAENVARNQLAYVFEQDYVNPGSSYLVVDESRLGFDPADYGLSVTATVGNLNLSEYESGCPYDPLGDPSLSKICIQVTHPEKGVMESMETVRIAE